MTKVLEKNKTKAEKKQPWWKRRLGSKFLELNKNLGKVNLLLDRKKMKNHQDNLQKRYQLKEKGKPKVKEEILQRITVKLLRPTDTSKG